MREDTLNSDLDFEEKVEELLKTLKRQNSYILVVTYDFQQTRVCETNCESRILKLNKNNRLQKCETV